MPSEPIVEPPLIPSAEALVQRAIAQLQAQYPNFAPNPASPEYRMFLAFAAMVTEYIILAFDVPEEIIRFMGEVVYQSPPFAAQYASTTSTWKAVDTLGHQIPAGTVVLVTPEGGEPIAFEVTEEIEIKPGESITSAGAVKLRAIEPGIEGNIVGGIVTVEPNETLSWVEPGGITLVTLPNGGEAEETTQAYTKRIRELAKLVKPQPILPEDFANYVRLLIPGITRCVAIDLLELKLYEGHQYGGNEVEATGVERCVTIIPLTAAGVAPSMTILREAWEKLEAAREGTFKSFVGIPTSHPIEVSVVGKFLKGFNKAAVEAAVTIALREMLNPAEFGVADTGDTTSWILKKVLRYQDVITVLNNVQGFNYYTTLEVNKATADVALAGIAPIVTAGAITVSLSEGTE
jgi:hypothetical protein